MGSQTFAPLAEKKSDAKARTPAPDSRPAIDKVLDSAPEGMPLFLLASPQEAAGFQGEPLVQKKASGSGCQCGGTCPKCRDDDLPWLQEKALSGSPRQIQLQPEAAGGSEPPISINVPGAAQGTAQPAPDSTPLVVEDDASALEPGQMRKGEFLSSLHRRICETSDQALSGLPLTARGCPTLERWLSYYGGRSVRHIERAIRLFAPGAGKAGSASGMIASIAEQVRNRMESRLSGGGSDAEAAGAPLDALNLGSLLMFKRDESGKRGASDAREVQSRLSPGRPLEGNVRSRMESAIGESFSDVRLHTDPKSNDLAGSLGARAFTIGSDVAFGAGEYQPGTLIGDALIAHELAHVVQQRGGSSSVAASPTESAGYDALEEQADASAVGAVASLWGGSRLGMAFGTGVSRLRSGLRLQRCGKTVKRCPPGKSWQVSGKPTGAGPVCICIWRCMTDTSPQPGGYSGPSVSCNPPCPKPSVEYVDDDYTLESEGTIEDPGSATHIGGHMTPLTGQAMCGCLPLDIEGTEGTEKVTAPLMETGLDLTDLAGMRGKVKRDPGTGRVTNKRPQTSTPRPRKPPAAQIAPKPPKPLVNIAPDGTMTHAQSGRKLVREGGLIRYETSKKGGKGGICYSCNPDYYEKKGNNWVRKPGVTLPSEKAKSKAPKDVSFDSIKNKKPVDIDPKKPATQLGVDSAMLQKLSPYIRDSAAVNRIREKTTVSDVKAQIAEEIVNQVAQKDLGSIKAAKKSTPTFFRGDEVSGPAPKQASSGAENAKLTDGVIAEVYTEGGKTKVFIHRMYEVKSGGASSKGLPKQVEWDYERIKEVGLSLRVRKEDGSVGWQKFAPEDITMPPRTKQASVVQGFTPTDVKAPGSGDVTKQYTPRDIPGMTEGDLTQAALMVLRSKSTSSAGGGTPTDSGE